MIASISSIGNEGFQLQYVLIGGRFFGVLDTFFGSRLSWGLVLNPTNVFGS
jgi:hypothetical protein